MDRVLADGRLWSLTLESQYNMQKLILIKHSKPEMVEGKTSHDWPLSEEGRRRCTPLADLLKPHAPATIITSEEPKAFQTGELLSQALNIPVASAPDLQEHDRTNVPVMQTRDFISAMAHFFQNPRDLVLGLESADDVLHRIGHAIESTMAANPGRNVAIITHGTSQALFLNKQKNKAGFDWWRSMGLPSFVVMSWPDRVVETVVESVEPRQK